MRRDLFQTAVLGLQCLALVANRVIVGNLQQHPGVTIGHRGQSYKTNETHYQNQMCHVMRNLNLPQFTVRFKYEKGIKPFVHIVSANRFKFVCPETARSSATLGYCQVPARSAIIMLLLQAIRVKKKFVCFQDPTALTRLLQSGQTGILKTDPDFGG
jgi:hypothetical protein